jgi:hypothetical protein
LPFPSPVGAGLQWAAEPGNATSNPQEKLFPMSAQMNPYRSPIHSFQLLRAKAFPGRHFCARSLAILFVLIVGSERLACAAQQTTAKAAPPDIIVFTNGDQLTGKFLRSAGGKAAFHSDLAGDVAVSWDKVREIHSASKFVVLQKGYQPGSKTLPTHLPEGNLSVKNNQIELTPRENAAPELIPLKNVEYVIDQPTFERALRREPGIFSGWTGSVTGGATVVQATQDTTTLNASVALVRVEPIVGWLSPHNRTLVGYQSSYGKITEPGTPTEKTVIYHAGAERDEYFSPKFYALAQVAFDHNFSQSLDLQQIYGGGVGRTLISQDKQTLDVKGTAQFEHQSFLNAAPGSNKSLFGSTFAANYMRKMSRGMIFNQQVFYIPAWSDMHAYSVGETDTMLLPVYKRLGFSVGTLDTYLNDPALTVPPTKGNSFQFNLGVTYSLPAPH